MNDKLSTIKKDPRFCVEKSFERIFNDLDLRREELKKAFEKQIDDHFTKLRNKLEDKKLSAINYLDYNKSEEVDFCDLLKEKETNNMENLCSKKKLDQTESMLKSIKEKSKEVKYKMFPYEYGEDFKLVYSDIQFDMNRLFGKIRSDVSFVYYESYIFKDQKMSFNIVEEVDDNKILFTTSNQILLWSGEKILRTFIGHTGKVNSVYKLKNDLFASCSSDDTIKIWNINNEECLKTLFNTKSVMKLKHLSNDHLASFSWDKTIQIWNYETGQSMINV